MSETNCIWSHLVDSTPAPCAWNGTLRILKVKKQHAQKVRDHSLTQQYILKEVADGNDIIFIYPPLH